MEKTFLITRYHSPSHEPNRVDLPQPWKSKPPNQPFYGKFVRLFVSPLSTFTTASRRSNGTVNRRLFNLFNRKLPPNPTVVNGVSSFDVTVDPTRNLSFRLPIRSFAAVPTASLPVIVYFHGSAFLFFSAASTS
ncbi:hypothetical protein JHK82_025289 [Glycine max]|nr:hypothetical protein JHK82_025289 [Glycine max]